MRSSLGGETYVRNQCAWGIQNFSGSRKGPASLSNMSASLQCDGCEDGCENASVGRADIVSHHQLLGRSLLIWPAELQSAPRAEAGEAALRRASCPESELAGLDL